MKPTEGIQVHEEVLIAAVRTSFAPMGMRHRPFVFKAIQDNIDRISDNAKVILLQHIGGFSADGWDEIRTMLEQSRAQRRLPV